MKSMSFVATGDSFITRRIAKGDCDQNLVDLIKSAEFRFTNLETTLHHNEGIPSALSGGTWAMSNPKVLKDLLNFEFNCITWANNHTLDYSYGGLFATERYLNEANIIHAGVGKNLASASEPRYLECKNGRIAIIGVTSTFHDFWRAGEQRSDIEGRPGINPLRYSTIYNIKSRYMDILKEIAYHTGINNENNLAIKEGFIGESEEFKFGNYSFSINENQGMKRTLLNQDIKRINKSINEGKRQADYVIVSIHCHEINNERKDEAPDFLEAFARNCIDEGAHAVIGHGPHIIRGVQVYKGRPIFYSLGNFIFQNETVEKLPSDFYEQYGLSHTATVTDAFDKRSENGTKGLRVNKSVWESVIPYWEMYEGTLTSLKFYPIELGYGLSRYRRGWPKLSEQTRILEELANLSIPYGTQFAIKNGVAEVKFD